MFTTALSQIGAGIHEAVRGIATHLPAATDIRVTVIGLVTDPKNWDRDRYSWQAPGVAVAAIKSRGTPGFGRLAYAAGVTPVESVDVVHAHGLWNGPTIAGALLARRAACPLVVSPHGMLESWALRHNATNKLLPWRLWERPIIASAGLLQAMSEREEHGFRTCSLRNDAMVNPIGLDFSKIQPRLGTTAGSRTCLFLSRLHPVKGLPILLQAWGRTRPAGWRLLIVGPDEANHRQELEQLTNALCLQDQVEFYGPAYGSDKWRLLASSDLFVLPSYSENFGLAVAEAMAAGLPVISTTGTPWGILAEQGLGWSVEPTAEALAAALNNATARSSADLARIGAAAACYARERFSWATIADQMGAAYRWLLGQGPAPAGLRIADGN